MSLDLLYHHHVLSSLASVLGRWWSTLRESLVSSHFLGDPPPRYGDSEVQNREQGPLVWVEIFGLWVRFVLGLKW